MDDSQPDPQESALRPAHSDLHPADPADDALTDPSSGSAKPDSDVLDAEPAVDDGLEESAEPGDGTLAPPPEAGDADRLQTAEWGRESEAARADTSDSAPVPTETPAP